MDIDKKGVKVFLNNQIKGIDVHLKRKDIDYDTRERLRLRKKGFIRVQNYIKRVDK